MAVKNRSLSILIVTGFLCLGTAYGQKLTFNGSPHKVIEIAPEASTGLAAVYVVDNLQACTVSYTSSSGNVIWQRYSNLGGGFAEPVTDVSRTGNTFTIHADGNDVGYIIDDGTRRHCFWTVNYSNHNLRLESFSVSEDDSECDRTVLAPAGQGDAITYYSINGRAVELSRDIEVEYRTLAYDEDAQVWRESQASVTFPSLRQHLSVDAPLCNTDFTLRGDRFLAEWGQEQQVVSGYYNTVAVNARTVVEQVEHTADNESRPSGDGELGGSAPAEITFRAFPTDAAVFREWQFSPSSEFEDITERFNQDEITRVFTDEGTVYARYVCADASGKCVYEGSVYPITIGASKLECPNAFSPANQDGINDEWKVSYTSIISFECNIFNRWGIKMATLNNPSQGWDGKYKGKFVPSGVYFYVIKAKGADGKAYDLSGDINIINSRISNSTGTSGEE